MAINHLATITRTYSCPSGQVAGVSDEWWIDPYYNTSSANVSAVLSGGGYGASSLTIRYTNWSISGDQRASIQLICL